jgi:hypothetical protein
MNYVNEPVDVFQFNLICEDKILSRKKVSENRMGLGRLN